MTVFVLTHPLIAIQPPAREGREGKRFFAGVSYLDLVRIHGIGKTTCYSSCIKTDIQAIHKNKEIGQPKWLEQTPDLEWHAHAWTDISGVQGNVGCSKAVWVQLMVC
jgi:hypothetical protein